MVKPIIETKVLVVEDSNIQAQYFKYLLEEKGYQVNHADNGQEAMNLIQDTIFDIIISDVQMPEMNGYQLCQKLKNNPDFSHIPIILLTNLLEMNDVIAGLEARADFYLAKAFVNAHLLDKVEEALITPPQHTIQDAEPFKLTYNNENYKIHSTPQKMFNFLASIYETTLYQNKTLIDMQNKLQDWNEELESTVNKRTRELKASEEKLEAILKGAPSFIVQLDLEGKINFVNRLLDNFTLEDTMGAYAVNFTKAEHQPLFLESLEAVLKEGETREFEAKAFNNKEEYVWYSCQLGPLKFESQIIGAILIAHNIELQKQL